MNSTKEFKEGLTTVKDLIEELKSILPKRIYAASLSLKSKIPFKAVSLREALLHRLVDLSCVAYDLYMRDKSIPAFIMTRAVMETQALLFSLHKKIKKVVAAEQLGDVDAFLMDALLGWRDGSMPAKAPNILKAVDEVDRTFTGYRKLYENISEFVHPNWSGCHGAYAKINKKNYTVDLGSEFSEVPTIIGLSALKASLAAFKYYYNDLAELLPAFIEICDADIEEKTI